VLTRLNGKLLPITIGDTRQITFEDAVVQARQIFAKIALNIHPNAERLAAQRQAAAAAYTVGKAIDAYLGWKEGRVRANTMQMSCRYLLNHWRPLHRYPLDGVSKSDVDDQLDVIVKTNGRMAGYAARKHLAAMFAWAVRKRGIGSNPVVLTEDPGKRIEPRSRTLTDAELRTIWTCTAGDDDFSKIMRLLLLTAARRSEVGGASWEEFDAENSRLRLPASRMKAARPHEIHLSAPALSILTAQPRRGDRAWIFGRGSSIGFQGWSGAKQALDQRIAKSTGRPLAPWSLHDARRSVASRLVGDLAAAPHVVDAILAHTPPKLHRTYVTSAYTSEMRLALAAWSKRLLEIVEDRAPRRQLFAGAKPDRVVALR
jgi:integrase